MGDRCSILTACRAVYKEALPELYRHRPITLTVKPSCITINDRLSYWISRATKPTMGMKPKDRNTITVDRKARKTSSFLKVNLRILLNHIQNITVFVEINTAYGCSHCHYDTKATKNLADTIWWLCHSLEANVSLRS